MAARLVAVASAAAACAAVLTAPAVIAASPSPTPSSGPAQLCQGPTSQDALSAATRVACEQVRNAVQPVTQAIAQAGQSVADAAETALTRWLADGAAWMLQGVASIITGSSTTPSLDPRQAAMFAGVYGRVAGVALSLSVLLVLIGIVEATLTQRPGGLRRVVVGIAVSGIGMGAIPIATAILILIIDDLSLYVAGGQPQVVAAGLHLVLQELQQTQPASGAAAFALTSLGLMLGGALLWLELVTREALIYLFLGVAPLACAAVQWPRLEGVLRQVLFAGLALILSKLVIVIALGVGFAVLAGGSGLTSLLGGMFVVVIAALMPFATASVLPLAGEELLRSHQGHARGWISAGAVGTSNAVVWALARHRAGGDSKGLPIAPPMGSSNSRDAGRSSQAAAAAAGGAAFRPAPPRSGPGRPRGRRPEAGGGTPPAS